MAKVSKEVRKSLTDRFFDWFLNYRIIEGCSNYIYIMLYQIIMAIIILGLKFCFYKDWFQISAISCLLIIILGFLDRIVSKGDNGLFSIFNWITVVIFAMSLYGGNFLYFVKTIQFFIPVLIAAIMLKMIPIIAKGGKIKWHII